jgi:hypothetical protein
MDLLCRKSVKLYVPDSLMTGIAITVCKPNVMDAVNVIGTIE